MEVKCKTLNFIILAFKKKIYIYIYPVTSYNQFQYFIKPVTTLVRPITSYLSSTKLIGRLLASFTP
jgi:hypothetical protein